MPTESVGVDELYAHLRPERPRTDNKSRTLQDSLLPTPGKRNDGRYGYIEVRIEPVHSSWADVLVDSKHLSILSPERR
jgi:hypothetical protein